MFETLSPLRKAQQWTGPRENTDSFRQQLALQEHVGYFATHSTDPIREICEAITLLSCRRRPLAK